MTAIISIRSQAFTHLLFKNYLLLYIMGENSGKQTQNLGLEKTMANYMVQVFLRS